jgi:hypothetical protein
MIHMARWQRVMYFFGEAVMIGGLIWGLISRFVLHACPAGVFNYLTLIIAGLTLSVLPVHPFGAPRYLNRSLRSTPVAGAIWWMLALIGLGYAIWDRATMQPGIWWFAALVPAMLYFWFAVQSRVDDGLKPPTRAVEPPPREGKKPSGKPESQPEPDNGSDENKPQEDGGD